MVVEGSDSSRSVNLGEQAVTLDSDADCTLRLADSGGRVGGQNARIWLREDHFVLHHLLGGRYATVVGKNSLKWAMAEDGEEIVIGPHKLCFESMGKSEG